MSWITHCDQVILAIEQQQNKRAVGKDSIPGELVNTAVTDYIRQCGILLVVRKRSSFTTNIIFRIRVLYKEQGIPFRLQFDYRGISLLSVPGKFFASILLSCLMELSEQRMEVFQCDNCKNRTETRVAFIYLCFVDIEKVFNSVSRKALWVVLEKIGCTEK